MAESLGRAGNHELQLEVPLGVDAYALVSAHTLVVAKPREDLSSTSVISPGDECGVSNESVTQHSLGWWVGGDG